MGCNCGKRRQTTVQSSTAKPVVTPRPKPKLGTAKESGTTQSFALELPSGRTQTFGSRLEAEAARVRQGGVVRPF